MSIDEAQFTDHVDDLAKAMRAGDKDVSPDNTEKYKQYFSAQAAMGRTLVARLIETEGISSFAELEKYAPQRDNTVESQQVIFETYDEDDGDTIIRGLE